ncbi:unnamed protein product [Spirodela intermedia]|uniref:Uncharacterized protein n=1 Tax=Spirodela intermedia TaxID=51605 RepID=A0A7I8K7W9_SPIIN|nr:unnamed protein product [Spirodela intermedia]
MVAYALTITRETLDPNDAIHLTKYQMYHERTKHIDIKYHFICDIISSYNLTDMLTKPLFISKFQHCLNLIGVHNT